MRFAAIIVCLLLLPTLVLASSDSQWKLAWEDNFQRATLGDGWINKGGEVSIENGRAKLNGCAMGILINREFADDVRLEYDAEVDPTRPPCDIGEIFGGTVDGGNHYIMQFGGMNNRWNAIQGTVPRTVHDHPPILIEKHKKYHMVGTREGNHFSYSVNGTVIAEATDKCPVGGPGFSHVGIFTWTGLYIWNVKVYERTTPVPGTNYLTHLPELPLMRDGLQIKAAPGVTAPGLDEALTAFNSGNMTDALAKFEAMGDTQIGLIGQACVMGDMRYEERYRGDDFVKFAERFEKAAKANPNDKVLAGYLPAAQMFAKISMNQGGEGDDQATMLVAAGTKNNPLYYKARYYGAKFLYWEGREGGNGAEINRSIAILNDLKKIWPQNAVLREYTGENIMWSPELNADTADAPEWAAYLREAYARQTKIMETWGTKRQDPTGAFGGGWGDDCEMMRTWMQVGAISSGAEGARTAIERLSEGIWRYQLEDGFANGVGDNEHSPEPSADTVPLMLFLRYGDPMWAERNMLSCKTIKTYFMGTDKKGYPRFISSEYGGKKVNTVFEAGGDTAYDARTMKHFMWQAWRGDPQARDFYVRWVDGWRAATMTKIQDKPIGIIPASIWYPSGEIYPKGHTWKEEGVNTMGVTFTGMIEGTFLGAYYLSHDPKFLKPWLMDMDWATHGPLIDTDNGPAGWDWIYHSNAHMPDTWKTALYRWLTDDTTYDEYTKRMGGPAELYPIDHDFDVYLKSLKNDLQPLRYNLEMQTTEVLATDRYPLPAALTTFGAYTGAVQELRDENVPTFAVTYDTPNTNYAALVHDTSTKRLRIWLYSFNDKPMKITIRPWLLETGSYILNQGEIVHGEHHVFQHRYTWLNPPQTVKILHRAEAIDVTVPPGKPWAVDLRLDNPIAVPSRAPDLAIATRDVTRTANGVDLVLHNIGNGDSKPFTVALQTKSGNGWKTIAQKQCPALPWPKNLTASRTKMSIPVAKSLIAGSFRVVLDPQSTQYDLYPDNNSCVVK